MANEMQDSKTIAKLAEGDMVAIEANYHAKCFLAFRRKYNAFVIYFGGTKTSENNDSVSEARAFAELVFLFYGNLGRKWDVFV
jgi:hypothetical protein